MLAMILIPYPLKLDAKGQLVPEDRNYIYPTGTGRVIQFKVNPGDIVRKDTPIAVMFDADLANEISKNLKEIQTAESEERTLGRLALEGTTAEKAKSLRPGHQERRTKLAQQIAANTPGHSQGGEEFSGVFTVVAPEFRPVRNGAGRYSTRF